MPKKLTDLDLDVPVGDIDLALVTDFYSAAWVEEEVEGERVVHLSCWPEEAHGYGVYAHLQDGTSMHLKDFQANGQNCPAADALCADLEEILAAYRYQPAADAHLETDYEDRVSGWDE